MQTFQGRDSAQGRDKVPEAGRFPAHVPSPQFDFLRHSTSSAPLLPDPEPPWQRPKPTEDSVHTLAWTPRPSRFSLGQGAGRVRLWMLVSCALDAGPWVSSWAAPISLHPIVYSITPFTGTAEGPQGGCHVQGTVPGQGLSCLGGSDPVPRVTGALPLVLMDMLWLQSSAWAPTHSLAHASPGVHILWRAHLPARASSGVVFCLTLIAWCPGPQMWWDPCSGERLINPAWPASYQSPPLLQGVCLHGSSPANHRPRCLAVSWPLSHPRRDSTWPGTCS